MQSKIEIYCKYIHADCLFSTIFLIINYGIESRRFLIPSLFSLKILLWSHLKYPLIGATPCAASSRSAIVRAFSWQIFSPLLFNQTQTNNFLSISIVRNLTNESCRASQNCGGQVTFDFRLPTGQIEFSGIFLTLLVEQSPQPPPPPPPPLESCNI